MKFPVLFKNEEEKQHAISVIKDPFGKDKLMTVSIRYTAEWGTPYWYATIEFKNGHTEGKQSTPHVTTFKEVIAHIEAIFASIK